MSSSSNETVLLTGTHGITHLTSPLHTPEHNGISERKHRHIVETGLSLLSTAHMPLHLWPLAFAAAVFLINRLPTPNLSNQSPYQKLFNQHPNYSKLRTFGCLAYPWLRPYAPNKLETRSLPCIFISYSLTRSAYQCLDPATGRVYTTRHVRFNEKQFPYSTLIHQKPTTSPEPPQNPTPAPPFTTVPAALPLIQSAPLASNAQPPGSETPPATVLHTPSSASPENSVDTANTDQEPTSPAPQSSESSAPSPPAPLEQEPAAAPLDPVQPAQPSHPMTTRSKNNITKPATKYNLAATVQCDPHWIPSTWQQAMKHAHWRKAMSGEFTSTTDNYTWDLVEVTKRMNVVG